MRYPRRLLAALATAAVLLLMAGGVAAGIVWRGVLGRKPDHEVECWW